ncbi:MAG: HAD family hydrolase [Deltaproteobacteria bacterium]|nr:HAD family hydrolase [Deltaproteobacteria bacterium]
MGDAGQAAVFVDRDGTLIRDVGYLCREEQLEILPRVPEAIRSLKERGYKIVVVTNQSAIARGFLTEVVLAGIHRELLAQLARLGAHVDAIYYCPHHPTEGFAPYKMVCDCRKPETAMIRLAAMELDLAPSRSYVVGDQIIDMELAARSGAKGIWIHDSGEIPGDISSAVAHVVPNLWEAARWITGTF